MSNYRAPAFNPATGRVEEADFLDNHFGHYAYGVKFDGDDKVFRAVDCGLEGCAKELDRLRKLARAMSDALLKVRPLGGSEMFIGYGGEYYADPHYCGELIEKLNEERTELIKQRFRMQKA